MQTIVYFSNEGIQIIQGSMKREQLIVSHFQTLPFESGTLINGVITNEEAVKQIIADALKTNKNIFKNLKLIIDSSLIATKNVEVPKLKPKELDALAVTEFEDSAGNYEELLVDYSSIPGPNGRNMFCCGIEKRVLASYINLFRSMKIPVMSIDVGLNTIIQYVSASKDYRGMTFSVNILDGKNLVSILFENGIYVFSNRSRLMAERGTTAFGEELSEKLSSLIQFNKAQRSEYALNMSVYAGMDEYELEILKAVIFDPAISLFIIPQTSNIKIGFKIEEVFDFGKFIYPIVGFFTGIKPINLAAVYKKSNVIKKKVPIAYKALAIPVGMIVFFLLLFGIFLALRFYAIKNLAEANAYINDPNNQEEYLQAMALTDEVEAINLQISNMEKINAAINTNPQLVSEKLNHMVTLLNGVIELNTVDYDGTTGAVHITATAKSERDAAGYVERLKSTQYFTQLDYTGYEKVISTRTETITNTGTTTGSSSTTNTTSTSGYSFEVIAYLKAGEQR
ncbi:hypothetical protein [Acetobacterium sp.]|uniref:hypothetical protein n=1 Tax=Acetobacterium sp. TaxID=1872094 RepID=UPI0035947C2C